MASISRRGDVWRAMVRRRGQSLTGTFDSEADAEAWAAREEARIVAGVSAAAVKQTPSGITLAALMDRYAREVSPSHTGGRWEQYTLAKLARSFPKPAIEYDPASLAEWRDRRLSEVSAGTVIRELSLISSVFKRAIREWRLPITANPARQIDRPKQPAHRKRRVSEAEREAIVKELGWDGLSQPDDKREWIAWSFCLALETMMRRGEILALTWQHVHLDKRYCHLPITKNGTSRDVPLSKEAMRLFGIIEAGLPGARVVPVMTATFVAYFRLAIAGACVEDMHFHDTRHEAITQKASRFKSILDLAGASGHKSLQSLKTYYHPDVTELAEQLD